MNDKHSIHFKHYYWLLRKICMVLGKMIDYVKCLDCLTEKSREDTFLDIPLPVRPFGSTVAYGSVVSIIHKYFLYILCSDKVEIGCYPKK